MNWDQFKTGTSVLIGIILGSLLCTFLVNVPQACKKNNPRNLNSKHRNVEQKSKIFLGIIFKDDIVDRNKTIAASTTWIKKGRWTINYFIGQNHRHLSIAGFNGQVVRLPDSHDSDTSVHKKYFLSLRFMHDHYINEYDWFILTNDDVYIDFERLEKLLNSYNASDEIVLGRSENKNGHVFVSDVPGIVLSRGLVSSLRPRLSSCIHHLHTDRVDEEIGRCIWEHTDAIIANSPQFNYLFYKQHSAMFLFKNFDEKSLEHAMFIAQISNDAIFYGFHKMYLNFEMKNKMKKTVNLKYEIDNSELLATFVKNSSLQQDEKYPFLFTKFNVLTIPMIDPLSSNTPWFAFTRLFRYQWNDMSRGHSKAEKNFVFDLISTVDEKLNEHCENKFAKAFKYGYMHKWNPNGIQFVTVYQTSNKKHCIVMGEQSYSVPMFVEAAGNNLNSKSVKYSKMLPKLSTKPYIGILSNQLRNILQMQQNITKVFIIVPIQGRFTSLENFMKNYEKNFLKNSQSIKEIFLQVHLVVVFMGSSGCMDRLAMNRAGTHLLAEYKNKYHNSHITFHDIDIGDKDFSRGAGLQVGSLEAEPDDIILFMDVDMILSLDVVKVCSKNSMQGKYAWYPIPFSQYDPNHMCTVPNNEHGLLKGIFGKAKNPKEQMLSEESGFWRDFGFGLACMYKSDFITTGGFDLSIEGWGEEDIQLYLSLIKSGVNIFRSKHKDLIHIFHQKMCSFDLNEVQFNACLRTRASHFASQKCLSDRLLTEQ